MEASGLVKMVVEKLKEVRGIGWWEEYKVLRRKLNWIMRLGWLVD